MRSRFKDGILFINISMTYIHIYDIIYMDKIDITHTNQTGGKLWENINISDGLKR
jgi:hypothetical protein